MVAMFTASTAPGPELTGRSDLEATAHAGLAALAAVARSVPWSQEVPSEAAGELRRALASRPLGLRTAKRRVRRQLERCPEDELAWRVWALLREIEQ